MSAKLLLETKYDWYIHRKYDNSNTENNIDTSNQIKIRDIYSIELNELMDKDIENLIIPTEFFINDNSYIHISQHMISYIYTRAEKDIILLKLMDKLHGIKKIVFECYMKCDSVIKMPSTLIELYSHSYLNFNLDECINLKSFMISAWGTYRKITYTIPNLPDGIEELSVYCNTFDDSINRLPSTIKKLNISCSSLGNNIEFWPINLQELNISIACDYHTQQYQYISEYSIGLLPHTLEKLKIKVYSYPFYIDFPPNLKTLQLEINNYPHSLADLPDSIVNLACYYNKDYYLDKLPENCKYFVYLECPNDKNSKNEFMNFCKQYKSRGIAIYKKFINKIHENIFNMR